MPISLRKVYMVKVLLSFLLIFGLGVGVAYFSNAPFARLTPSNRMLIWFGIYNAFWISVVTTAVNAGLGGYFVNYQEKNPIRIASSQGATLTFLLTLVYLVFMVALIALPIKHHFDAIFLHTPLNPNSLLSSSLAFGIFSTVVTMLGLSIGFRSLKRDF